MILRLGVPVACAASKLPFYVAVVLNFLRSLAKASFENNGSAKRSYALSPKRVSKTMAVPSAPTLHVVTLHIVLIIFLLFGLLHTYFTIDFVVDQQSQG